VAEKKRQKEQEGSVSWLIFVVREYTWCTGKWGASFPGKLSATQLDFDL